MTLKDVKEILDCELIFGEEFLETNVHTACSSDMMSDVLAYVKDQAILLSGLVNPQVVRTAEMMDMLCVIFVRGKYPDPETIALAKNRDIVLMATKHRMFSSCGLLWENGLRGGNS